MFGVWNKGNELDDEPDGKDAKNKWSEYCPICRDQMKMWSEGCCLLYIICKKCRLKFTLILENKEMYKKLEDLVYEAI